MKTIIAATDYTELAESAVNYAAAAIAGLNNYRLILFNDFTIPIHAMSAAVSANEVQELIDENKVLLEAKALLLAQQYGIEVLPVTTFSFVAGAIQELITKYAPELIVMGMEEKTLEQELLGNTTTSVIKKLHVPVLAVPANVKYKGLKKVLFSCDVVHGVSGQLLERIKEIALVTQAEVEILLINETVEELKAKGTDLDALRRIDEGLEGIDYYYKNIKSDSIIRGIGGEIKRMDADLLIMAPQQHGFWGSMVHRSKTRIMASGLNIPLLSFPV
ncbi:universal stress protein [Mucilaginibacter sp. HC2]|uniref:universal stress protein n=1 Tax=Mucilaginibacter TaxID=423349 RepID=UPI000DCE9C9B|nr:MULTISPECIES: universal stress protein [Mucilaginibacter]NHA05524.1 universal stress protein [Mucilaginibacter inviolabilis]QTE35332.1 universal stress protein [Mucilaginibacter gossypii]RAV59465.1 universal stress protein [Mucilaginibacter rubeus]